MILFVSLSVPGPKRPKKVQSDVDTLSAQDYMYVQYVQFFVGSFPTLQYGPRGVNCFNQINKSKNYATSSAIRIFSIFCLKN